jgi:glycosyltransferase involved in cell wall biosynthesis
VDLTPLVTVVLPVRNGGPLLLTAVASIRSQTYSHWELLLMDDGSDDGFVDRVAQLGDARIRIVRAHSSVGIAAQLNHGIALARGSLLARMDADDVSFPQRLACQVQALLADKQLDLLGTSTAMIDEQDRLCGLFPRALEHAELAARPWRGFHLPHPSWMGRTAWFRAHPYAEPAPYRCEDQELLLRTYRHSRFGCTDKVLLAYRVRDHIDAAELARTRGAWWHCQRSQFRHEANWQYLILAWCCHRLRWLKDHAARRVGARVVHADAVPLPPGLADQWNVICASLRSDYRAWPSGTKPGTKSCSSASIRLL